MDCKIRILDQKSFQTKIITSLHNYVNKKNKIINGQMIIHVHYSKIKKIVTELQLFPNVLNNLMFEYANDVIIVDYNISFSLKNGYVDGHIHYSAEGYAYDYNSINTMLNKELKFAYDQIITIFSTSINNGYSSIWKKDPMSFFDEFIISPSSINDNFFVDDHIDFINFYMNHHYNKKKYLEENAYAYTYTGTNDIFTGKQQIYNNVTHDIDNYIIIRRITNEDHLIICAKIIKKISKMVNLINNEFQIIIKKL